MYKVYTKEEILELIFDQLPYVFWKDRNGVYQGANKNQALNMGFNSPSDFIGKTIHEILPRESANLIEQTDNQIMQSGTTKIVEEPLIINNEHKVYLSSKTPLYSENHEIIGLLGMAMDVTSLKKAEAKERAEKEKAQLLLQEALEAAKKRAETTLDRIMSVMPGHVYWKDENGVYLGCNDRQAISLGFQSGSEIIGKTDFDLPWAKGNAERFRENDLRVLHTRQPLMAEEEAIFDGKPGIVFSHKVPLYDEKDDIVGVVGVSLDITEKKKAEELEKQNTIIQEKYSVMQLLAGSIAHELRTPLATITLLINGLKNTLSDLVKGYQLAYKHHLLGDVKPLSDKQLKHLERVSLNIQEVVNRANIVIDMLLTKVNVERTRSKENQIVSASTCVRNAIETYSFHEANRLQVHFNDQNDFAFYGNEILLMHVLYNLFKNSLHAIMVAGRGDINIWFEQRKKDNVIHFKDTGKGMAPDVLEKIFTQFYTDTYHGTGVGLAFCKMVMENFGGTISCDSKEGQYTHFMLSFPKPEENEAS